MLDLGGRCVVIIGGGAVAARKAAGVLEAGARGVRVVAPEVSGSFDPAVAVVRERYRPEHLNGAGLVFAATDDPAVNGAVVRDARARGVLVCRTDADEQEPGDFSTPARFREQSITVAVSAGGNPALAAMIRDGLRQRWDDRWSRMADAMAELRPMIRQSLASRPSDRARALRSLASDEALAMLESNGIDGLRRWLTQRMS
jgi:siroheme synthase-like protein